MIIATRTLIVLLLIFMRCSVAAIEHREFKDEASAALYYDVIQELRCLVCQNQNLAESNADLARDLRDRTYKMIKEGADKSGIIQFMTDRYGDYVLYRPPFKSSTFVLWLAPLGLICLGLLIWWRVGRRPESNQSGVVPDEDKLALARRLLASQNDNNPGS